MKTLEYENALNLALKVRAEKRAEVAASIILSALREVKPSEDTERLDWLEDWLEKVNWDDFSTVREAIDAARGKEKEVCSQCGYDHSDVTENL